jgi:protein-L-isoaspartate(D-aspartate) O-methyltransferase
MVTKGVMDGWMLATAAALCGSAVAMARSRRASPRHEPADADEARGKLVSEIVSRRRLSPRVAAALAEVPRHLFVEAPIDRAYEDAPQPIGWGQTISQPTIVAMMSEALSLDGTERVLEIGTGSGYQAAVLSRLAAQVDSIEVVAQLAVAARERLRALGCSNVEVRCGDGYEGWPERAPYDRIILTAAPPTLPERLLEQLEDDGLLVAPIGERGEQRLKAYRKTGATVDDLGPVLFVPMVH